MGNATLRGAGGVAICLSGAARLITCRPWDLLVLAHIFPFRGSFCGAIGM